MNSKNKILSLEELSQKTRDFRERGKKVVLCHGCFDLLHIGHIRHFRQARQHGDVLVVTLTPDKFVDKGPDRPAFTETLRAEAIASLGIVDYVTVNEWPTADKTIKVLKPDVYVKGYEFKESGSDYTGKISAEIDAINDIGGTTIFTEDIVFSSTNLINRFLKNTQDDTQEYFNLFKSRFALESIYDVLEKMGELKVMVIGDAIIDDYHYCEAIGKSNKDPVLALKYKSSDIFAGGALAVANHLASFAGKVKLLTVIGGYDDYENFIRSQLHEKVDCEFIYNPNAPTIVKRRFLDGYSFNKLFEVYIMDGNELPVDIDEAFRNKFNEIVDGYDLIISADFGHGAISEKMIQTLCASNKYLAVNTQANAGNRGFHTISKYQRADFVSLAEHEIRLDTRNNTTPLRPMMEKIAERLDCKSFIVTRGRRGCLVRGENGDFVSVPSLTSQVVDRIGAGDALFSVSALISALDADYELVGFMGNVAGSLAVETIGNKVSVDKIAVKKYITSLLK